MAVVLPAYTDMNTWVSPLYLLAGFRRVYITRCLLETLDLEGLEAVAAHEVAHLERKQVLVQAALFIAAATLAPAMLLALSEF